MTRKGWMAGLCLVLFSCVLWAAEWWEKKPFVEWRTSDVQRMLDDSPWGRVHTVTIANTNVSTNFQTAGAGDLEREKRNRFHIRFLTAKPIRMAIARNVLLKNEDNVTEQGMAGLNRFVEQPDDLRIIVLLDISVVPPGSSSLSDYRSALLNLRTSNLAANTFLATKTGKRVYLLHYEPPGDDGLGAKYLFPRFMEDGSPFVTAADGEVRFETMISLRRLEGAAASETNIPSLATESSRTDRIWTQFKLDKMVFNGKLEI